MKHYDITIIGADSTSSILARKFQDKYKVLLVNKQPLNKKYHLVDESHIDIVYSTRYRNNIKTENGYIVILHKERKNIEISTDLLIKIDEINIAV